MEDVLLTRAADPFSQTLNVLRSWLTVFINGGAGNPNSFKYIQVHVWAPILQDLFLIICVIIALKVVISIFKRFSR